MKKKKKFIIPKVPKNCDGRLLRGIGVLLILTIIAVAVAAKNSGKCISSQEFNDTESRAMKRFLSLAEPNSFFRLESSRLSENGCLAYGAVKQQNPKSTKVFGVVYNFKTKKISKERGRNPADVSCEVQSSSQNFRVEYLCYNPTVGAGETIGTMYAYDAFKKQTFRNDCRVIFGGGKQLECSNWVRIK